MTISIWFVIILTICVSGMLAIMYLSLETSVTAGDANSTCMYKIPSSNRRRSRIQVNGVEYNVKDMLSLIVCGNSMKNYNIHDGNRVYVEVLSEENKMNIERYPVIVYDNKHRKSDLYSHYKLRKFVGYVETLNNLYEVFNERIQITKEIFDTDIKNSSCDLSDKSKKVVLSETFDKNLNRNRYSLHHAENIVGIVRFNQRS